MIECCGDDVMETYSLFQEKDGGSIPTSPLQFFIRKISKKTAYQGYNKWHYLKDTLFISTIDFGAYYENELYGAISFGAPNAKKMQGYYTEKTQQGWWEIKRLAMSEKAPKNSESRFIAISIKMLRKIHKVLGIITLADSEMGHVGTIYKASGFNYVGMTAPKSDFLFNGKKIQRGKVKHLDGAWIKRSRKHLYIKIFEVFPA